MGRLRIISYIRVARWADWNQLAGGLPDHPIGPELEALAQRRNYALFKSSLMCVQSGTVIPKSACHRFRWNS